MFSQFQDANKHLNVFDSTDNRLADYGRTVELPQAWLGALLAAADKAVPDNPGDVTYVACEGQLQDGPWLPVLEAIFGHMPVQVGWCASRNSTLNGLEYHHSPEVIVAVSDLALLLGKPADIDKALQYDSDKVECLYLRRGEVVRLHPEILHFSPCRVSSAPFKSIIVLPLGTNTPLPESTGTPASSGAAANTEAAGEDKLLFMKNKWLLAHPEREPLMKRGAWPGIRGANVEVKIVG